MDTMNVTPWVYREIIKAMNATATGEWLTYILMKNRTSLIFKYMYENQLFSWYMGKSESNQYMLENSEEDFSHIEVLALIESGIEDLENWLYITPLDDVLQQANDIAKRLGKVVVDEVVLTIAVIQSENFLLKLLACCDKNGKAGDMLRSHFCEANLVDGCLMDPCGAYYN